MRGGRARGMDVWRLHRLSVFAVMPANKRHSGEKATFSQNGLMGKLQRELRLQTGEHCPIREKQECAESEHEQTRCARLPPSELHSC